MARRARDLVLLCLLLLAMDQLYRVLHPHVDLVRATLVGLTAFATLRALDLLGLRWVGAVRGGVAVFASAFGSVLAIEAGWLVSRSPASVVVHGVLLVVAFMALDVPGYLRREASTARTSSSGTSAGAGASPPSAATASRIVSE